MSDSKNNITILFPGAMKPFHDGHLTILESFLSCEGVQKAHILISPKVRSGVEADCTYNFINKFIEKLPVEDCRLQICDSSPIRAAYFLASHPESDDEVFCLGTSTKGEDADRNEKFYYDFTEGKYKGNAKVTQLAASMEPTLYEGRDDEFEGFPVSSSIIRLDAASKHYDKFKTAYKNLLDKEYVTEDDVKKYYDVICKQVEFDDSDKEKILALLNESINTSNKYSIRESAKAIEIENDDTADSTTSPEKRNDNETTIIMAKSNMSEGLSPKAFDGYTDVDSMDDTQDYNTSDFSDDARGGVRPTNADIMEFPEDLVNNLEADYQPESFPELIALAYRDDSTFWMDEHFGDQVKTTFNGKPVFLMLDENQQRDIVLYVGVRDNSGNKQKCSITLDWETKEDDYRDLIEWLCSMLGTPTMENLTESKCCKCTKTSKSVKKEVDECSEGKDGKCKGKKCDCKEDEESKKDEDEKALNERRNKMITLTEALKATDPKMQDRLDKSVENVQAALASIGAEKLMGNSPDAEKKNKEIYNNALRKIKKEKNTFKKAGVDLTKVPGVKGMLKKAEKMGLKIDAITEQKAARIYKQLNEKKGYLFDNKKVDGKPLKCYSSKEIYEMLKTATESYHKFMIKAVNEKALPGGAIEKELAHRDKLVQILKEELTYRQYARNILAKRANLNESEEAKKDEDLKNAEKPVNEGDDAADTTGFDFGNAFGDFGMDNASSDDKDEKKKDDSKDNESDGKDSESDDSENSESEEVEVSAISFKMKNREAADNFIAVCKENDIPEDALEIVGDDKKDESTNESKKPYTLEDKFLALFEDEAVDAPADDQNEDNAEGDETNTSTDDASGDDQNNLDDDNSDDNAEDGEVEVQLIDTDYIKQLIDVLKDVYGFTDEEIREKLGGEIVDDADNSDDDKSDKEDADKDDAAAGDDKDADVEEIDPNEIFKDVD